MRKFKCYYSNPQKQFCKSFLWTWRTKIFRSMEIPTKPHKNAKQKIPQQHYHPFIKKNKEKKNK